MSAWNKRAVVTPGFLAAAFVAVLSLGAAGQPSRTTTQRAEVERGKYLVEEVAK